MTQKPLFRSAAISACRPQWLGDIVLVRPLSFAFATAVAAGLAMLILGFLMLGSYTKRSSATGQLAPDGGMVRVYAPQTGIVVQKLVREGQAVRQGDVLYLISSDRQSSTQGSVQAAISNQVAQRQRSLRDELQQTRKMHQDEVSALTKKIDSLAAEQANITKQLVGQQSRTKLADDAVKRTAQLLAQGYVSRDAMQQKQVDLLDQHSRQQALERDSISVARELQAQRNELTSLPLRQQNQVAQIERLLASTEQEWTESEARRGLSITAPESGVATAITAESGQTVDGGRPLVSIVPQGTSLQAHLYAPSRAIGFIQPNDKVLLRYQAFPYQKFGHALGIVTSVSKTALPPSEFTDMPIATAGSGEPLYRITVKLARQTLTAYGKPQALQAGMLVEADILQETRKLYEWVLEPLYSLTGKL